MQGRWCPLQKERKRHGLIELSIAIDRSLNGFHVWWMRLDTNDSDRPVLPSSVQANAYM